MVLWQTQYLPTIRGHENLEEHASLISTWSSRAYNDSLPINMTAMTPNQ